MTKTTRLLFAALGAAAAAGILASPLAAATPPSPPVVEYTIAVSLDPAAKTLDGTETLIWRNPSGDAVPELRFHLYLNAFKNNRSTFMRESGGQLRGDEAGTKPGDWGWIDVSALSADGVELRKAARFVQPDGNDPSDETVLAVPLPHPVPPHGTVTLQIAFRSKLPKIFARTGFVRDYFLVGQWYPKIGVYEPAGVRERQAGGWNCHAFHAYSEFYADYGRFDVSFTVPSRFVVGATGRRVSATKNRDRTTYRYVQDDVHDFAWTADPRFAVTEFSFDPARDVPKGWSATAAKELGMSEAEIALRPVPVIRLLMQPGHERARDRYVRSIKEAISYYGLWYGAYPYETLTVVDPPDDGEGSGGMEYPTFITGGEANAWMTRWPFERARLVEIVTVHEYGHQYWYGMVGSNEFEESWLDEGLNDDSEHRAMALAYGPRDTAEFPGGVGADSLSIAHSEYNFVSNLDPIRRCAWCFASGASYNVNSYPKVGLLMAQLKNDLGTQTFSRAQRAYFQEWSFRHPTTSDFFRTFERVAGRDLSNYRRHLVERTARLDWQVVSAKTGRADEDEGVFDRPQGRVTLEEESRGPEPLNERKMYTSQVLLGNTEDWTHGATARMVFEDGRVVDRRIPEGAQWVRYRIRYGSRLAWAAVDPERRNAWDWNRLNDSKVLGTGKGAADTLGRRAAAKYTAFAAFFVGVWTQLLWVLA
ncbi:MAG TPA: M1 family metallopeptidase [Thermoanaerobaculia bacterium]